jgi:hypothetical protein
MVRGSKLGLEEEMSAQTNQNHTFFEVSAEQAKSQRGHVKINPILAATLGVLLVLFRFFPNRYESPQNGG